MAGEQINHDEIQQAMADMANLRQFEGPSSEFWLRYIESATRLLAATKGVLILKDEAAPEPQQLRKIGEWPAGTDRNTTVAEFARSWGRIAVACADQSPFLESVGAKGQTTQNFFVAARLEVAGGSQVCVAAFCLLGFTDTTVREALNRLQLVADVPVSYQVCNSVGQARGETEKFAAALDLTVLVNNEKRFLAATLALCNGLATRFHCDRVSVGWLEKGYIRVRSISRTEKFDKNMSAVQALETAMEESFDQDDEIIFPAPDDATFVARDHESFSKDQKVEHLCSVPLRKEDEPIAVITLERQSSAFSVIEMQQLRLIGDQTVFRLEDLKKQDRWFGARWTSATREKLASLVGPEHTWAKILALTITLILLVTIFGRLNYRVEANFILRSDEVSFLTAPFDGYIDEALARPGDLVSAGQILLKLNTKDLLLEEAAAIADLNRYRRESEKARAQNGLADMRIADALADQAQARLDLAQYRLMQADIKAAFDGIVVEGDLEERIGAPVKQGDALFRLAHIDKLYVEAEVTEEDLHEILEKKTGEIAFVSRPNLKFPVNIAQIEPAAASRQSGNVFLVRCEIEGEFQEWWRPGMSGLCKLNVGDRRIIWIITHRTVDFLRLWLWW
ncbi:MAG: multidrug resistance efflux pump [Candidatus Binatia bacterium]|jgi:multidrug resistance efflux pump